MSYKRLHTRLKGPRTSFDQLENAFEAEGRALQHSFTPLIHHPVSDYAAEIERIRKIDPKLGRTFERLNRHQRHAVFYPAKNAILAAMVGSGKTTVLIAKLFYLHFIEQLPFEQMVVLTFTNKAAREIKERIESFLGGIDVTINKQLRYLGTFHAVARQLLEEHPHLEKIGFKPGFLIMDEQEKQEFLERIITQEDLTIKYQNQLTRRWRKYHETGEAMMGNMKVEDDFLKLVQFAELEKRTINTMDFDDLISLCNKLMTEHGALSPKWIIIDEFQDCNDEQLDLIEHLRGDRSQLFAVGDQNQSIYGWRGSKEHLFQEMQSRWDATWMELPQNYRSTENILSAAESLLQQNDSALIATRQKGASVDLVRHFDDQQEAYYLREQLLALQKENGSLDTVAVLFRTHQQIKIVETVLAQASVPYQLVKRTELHENPAQAFLLRVFKLCINHNDLDACLAMMCDKTFGALKRTKTLIQTLHNRPSGTSVLQAMRQYPQLREHRAKEHLCLLEQLDQFCGEFLQNTDASAQQLIDFLALRSLLKPTSIHHAGYLAAITEAWDQVKRYMKDNGWGDGSSIFHIAIDQVILEGTFQINDRIKESGHGVHLLTIHASKGLEFDRVYIAGANTGIIPLTQHQKGSSNLKEEKRLLFVAMTRGKNIVEIGWHAQPSIRHAEPEPSYFLNAIPEALLTRRISAASQADQLPDRQPDEWSINGRVQHKKYGIGKITAIEEQQLICTFDSVGEKSFLKAFARALLTKVDSF